jgi:hypothetical protein
VERVLMGKPEGKRQLGRPRRRWENNTGRRRSSELIINKNNILLKVINTTRFVTPQRSLLTKSEGHCLC